MIKQTENKTVSELKGWSEQAIINYIDVHYKKELRAKIISAMKELDFNSPLVKEFTNGMEWEDFYYGYLSTVYEYVIELRWSETLANFLDRTVGIFMSEKWSAAADKHPDKKKRVEVVPLNEVELYLNKIIEGMEFNWQRISMSEGGVWVEEGIKGLQKLIATAKKGSK